MKILNSALEYATSWDIVKRVSQAVYPFKPLFMRSWVDDDFNFNAYKFVIEAHYSNNYYEHVSFYIDRNVIYKMELVDYYDMIMWNTFEGFRNLKINRELTDNVVLGEN